MRIWFLFLYLGLLLHGAETPPPILAQGDALVLSDGRSFTSWSIRRQTASHVFILDEKGVTSVDKHLLPESLRGIFPIDEEAIAAEKRALDLADSKVRAKLAAKAAQEKQLRERRIAVALAEEKAKALAELNHEIADARGDERDGLFLGYRGFEIIGDQVAITMLNVTSEPREFHWKELRGKFPDGTILTPSASLSPKEKGGDFIVPPRSKRKFILRFEGPPPRLVAWKGEIWMQEASTIGVWRQTIIDSSLTGPPR